MPATFSYAGWHLAYDGVIDPEYAGLLKDQDYLRRVLLDLADALDMTVLIGPQLSPTNLDPDREVDPDTEGVTGVVLVSTSHITLHTWPLKSRFSMGVFSAVEFDQEKAEALIKERLHVRVRSIHWIHRIWPD